MEAAKGVFALILLFALGIAIIAKPEFLWKVEHILSVKTKSHLI